MNKAGKWRRVLAVMLTVVMMLQNVQSVMWAAETGISTYDAAGEGEIGEPSDPDGGDDSDGGNDPDGKKDPDDEDFDDGNDQDDGDDQGDKDGSGKDNNPGNEADPDNPDQGDKVNPDGKEDPDQKNDPENKDESNVVESKEYAGSIDSTSVKVTATGINLPNQDESNFTVADAGKITDDSNDLKNALGISDENMLWFSQQYQIALNVSEGSSITDGDVSITIPDNTLGTADLNKESTARYVCYYIPENGTASQAVILSDAQIAKSGQNIYVTGITYPDRGASVNGTYGIVAYRRSHQEEIPLKTDTVNRITDASWQYRTETDGEWITLDPDSESAAIPADAEVKINVEYSFANDTEFNGTLVAGDKLVYTFPSDLGMTVGEQDGEILNDNRDAIGNYKIENGKVTLSFYNDTTSDHKAFFDENGIASGVKGKFSFWGKLSNVPNGNGTTTVTVKVGDLTLEIPVQQIPEEEKADIQIVKSVIDNQGQTGGDTLVFGDKLIYTLEVTAGEGNNIYLTGINIADNFKNTLVYDRGYSTGLALASDWDGKVGGTSVIDGFSKAAIGEDDSRAVYWKYEPSEKTIAGAEQTPGITGVQYTLTGRNFLNTVILQGNNTDETVGVSTGVMKPGDKLIIKYAVAMNENILMKDTNNNYLSDVTYTLKNSAKVTTKENTVGDSQQDIQYKYHKIWLRKTARVLSDKQVLYEIVSNRAPSYNIEGWTFTDTLGADQGQQYDEIKVEWFNFEDTSLSTPLGSKVWKLNDANGTNDSSGFTVTGNDPLTSSPEFQWTVPQGQGEYIYRFTYKVNLKKADHDNDHRQNLTNTVELVSPDPQHTYHFTASVNTGQVDYSRFKLEKQRGDVDVANNAISWTSTISSTGYSGSSNMLPVGSVYTDTIPDESGIHYMTEEQLKSVIVTSGETTLTRKQSDADTEADADYELTPTYNSSGKCNGFRITFLKPTEAPVRITYKTTANFPEASELSVAKFNNSAVFKINDDGWSSKPKDDYEYNFSKVFSKEATGTYDAVNKTLKWTLKVKNPGTTEIPAGFKITDILPEGLEFVDAESKTSGINISTETLNNGNVVITVNNPLGSNQELSILVTTKVTDKLGDGEAKTYLNRAELSINGTTYGTSQATHTIGNKILEKVGLFKKTGFVDYTISINKSGEKLVADDHTTSANPLYVVDHMGSNMQLKADSVKVMAGGKEYNDYKISKGTSDQDFVIRNLPDQKHIVITYSVSLTDPLGPTNIANSAELYYDSVCVTSDSFSQRVVIMEADASASSSANVYVQKYSTDYKSLSGVTFVLGKAVSDGNGGFTVSEENTVSDTQITDKDGRAYFKNLQYFDGSSDTVYYIRETSTIKDYKLNDTPYIFVIPKKASDSANVPAGVNMVGSGSGITVFNEKDENETTVTLTGQKVVDNGALSEGQFRFKIEALTDQTTNQKSPLQNEAGQEITSREVTNEADGTIDFGTIKYTSEGSFRYKITEVIPDEAGSPNESNQRAYNGMLYDASAYWVTVTVTTENKKLVAGTKVSASENEAGNGEDSAESQTEIVFRNIYISEATGSFTPSVVKRVFPENRTQELGKFEFKLEGTKLEETASGADVEFPNSAEELTALDSEMSPVQSKTGAALEDGSVKFDDITYIKGVVKDEAGNAKTVDQTGKYVYKLTEVDNKLSGYQYAQKPFYIYVEVTDDHEGNLSTDVSYYTIDTVTDPETGKEAKQIVEAEGDKALFINTYAGEKELTLGAVKSLEGRKIKEGQFKFSLEVSDKPDGTYEAVKDKDGNPVIASNTADGMIEFPALKFEHSSAGTGNYDIGTYYFRISEVKDADASDAYTYSTESYIIKVTAEQADQASDEVKISTWIVNGTDEKPYSADQIKFVNSYKASGSITLKGTKTLFGSTLVKDQFTFELLDEDRKTVLKTVKNAADGSIAFEKISYDQEVISDAADGTVQKIYYIREKVTDAERADGITYDSTLYKVIVTVTDNGDGKLITSSQIKVVSGTGEKDVQEIKFANTFAGTATITKTAEDGKTPLSGAEFELYAASGSGYTLYGKYTSDSNGKISVTGLPANSYYFIETKAPAGYLIPKDAEGNAVKYSFVIGVDAGAGKVAGAVADFSQTVVNGVGYGTAEITKYNADETKTLAGAQFTLYDADGNQIVVRRNADGNYTYSQNASENTEIRLVTGKDGRITVDGLMWGSYYFQETEAPEGYILSDAKISFTVNADSFDADGNPVMIKVKVGNKATRVMIEKVDEDGKALAGASMAIRDPQTRQIIETWTSTSEPHVIEGVLTAGKTYYLSELQAPKGYEIAADQEFTVSSDGTVSVTVIDKKSNKKEEGSVTVTKKISLVDTDANIVEAYAKDYTAYIGIFTDPAGEHPYGGNYLQAVQIHNGSSGNVTFTGLPKGTYYIFETDASGTPIAYDDFQISDIGNFICTVEDGSTTVTVKNKSNDSITLNNVYYDFPDGFAYSGNINITKKVVKGETETEVNDTFYAGIFTKDSDGNYNLLSDMVYELLQNDTISVNVPLGGENGTEPVTYYVLETDETGNPVDTDSFAYEVSGEGTVSLDKDKLEGNVTIVNKVKEKAVPTPTPSITPSAPENVSGGSTTVETHVPDSKSAVAAKTGDNTPIGAYAAVLVIAALAIAGGVVYKKKKKKDDR